MGGKTKIPGVCGSATHPGGFPKHKDPAGTTCGRSQKLEVRDPRARLGQELRCPWFRQGMEVTGE